MLSARHSGVLVALRTALQGQTGWYVGPNGFLYYFVLDQGNWILACGPLNNEAFEEARMAAKLLQMHQQHQLLNYQQLQEEKAKRLADKKKAVGGKGGGAGKAVGAQSKGTPTGGQEGGVSVSMLLSPDYAPPALARCPFPLSVEHAGYYKGAALYMEAKAGTDRMFVAISVESYILQSQLMSASVSLAAEGDWDSLSLS